MNEEDDDAVAKFSASLADIEEKVKRLQSLPWSQICGPDTPPLDSARLHLMVAYAVNALFWMYLRARGEKVAGHPVKAELERVKKALRKVKEAEALQASDNAASAVQNALTANQQPVARVDTDAARRFVTAALNGSSDGDAAACGSSSTTGGTGPTPSREDSKGNRDNETTLGSTYSTASRAADAAAEAASRRDAQAARGILAKSQREPGSSASTDDAAEDAVAGRALAATIAEHAARLEDTDQEPKAPTPAAEEAQPGRKEKKKKKKSVERASDEAPSSGAKRAKTHR